MRHYFIGVAKTLEIRKRRGTGYSLECESFIPSTAAEQSQNTLGVGILTERNHGVDLFTTAAYLLIIVDVLGFFFFSFVLFSFGKMGSM